MEDSAFALVLVIVVALAFDFTNGFHDAANAMATSVATGALKPRVAVLLSSLLNVVGAFLSLKVATTIAESILDTATVSLAIVSAALLGAIGLGTYAGGWRIMRTLGHRITDVRPSQGFSAETVGGTVILASSYYGLPLSTTHVVGGSVLASGLGLGRNVRWSWTVSMLTAWLLTLPGAALLAGLARLCEEQLGGAESVTGVGQTIRYRLDPSGDRRLNRALRMILVTLRRTHPPTIAYLDREHATARPAAKQSGASSATSFAAFTACSNADGRSRLDKHRSVAGIGERVLAQSSLLLA
jgi:Phosphate transporter family